MAYPAGYLDPSVDSTVEMPVGQEIYEFTAPVWPSTVISQYANSTKLKKLIGSFSDALNTQSLSDSFYTNVWNIDTASGYGLDVLGRIVGVKRNLYIPGGTSGALFGWGNAGSGAGGYSGWDQAPWNTGNNLTPNYSLTDSDYRRLILVKAFSNISNRSIPSINAGLMTMFSGQGDVYVEDTSALVSGPMMMRYVFKFQPSVLDLAILQQSGAFAIPSGVAVSILISP